MSPQERLEFERMKRELENIKRVTDVSFIAEIKRRLEIDRDVQAAFRSLKLSDLSDVDIVAPTNGQVLKYTTSGVDRWINSTDNT